MWLKVGFTCESNIHTYADAPRIAESPGSLSLYHRCYTNLTSFGVMKNLLLQCWNPMNNSSSHILNENNFLHLRPKTISFVERHFSTVLFFCPFSIQSQNFFLKFCYDDRFLSFVYNNISFIKSIFRKSFGSLYKQNFTWSKIIMQLRRGGLLRVKENVNEDKKRTGFRKTQDDDWCYIKFLKIVFNRESSNRKWPLQVRRVSEEIIRIERLYLVISITKW